MLSKQVAFKSPISCSVVGTAEFSEIQLDTLRSSPAMESFRAAPILLGGASSTRELFCISAGVDWPSSLGLTRTLRVDRLTARHLSLQAASVRCEWSASTPAPKARCPLCA